ncbi:hypothetical protein SAMN05192532_10776 [Alteribacillus iranensis]|uniref:Uncharacterized protein n=1 Tax=Alteribacillus iranensis TaxID=930128 RepID=A0A1I2EYL9_9BACI|nr:hypothetical protein SAMN05192532_10776 [Alteribacillus iranensis]
MHKFMIMMQISTYYKKVRIILILIPCIYEYKSGTIEQGEKQNNKGGMDSEEATTHKLK